MTGTLHRLELNPRRTLAVGDITGDIETGQAAGTVTAAISSGPEKKALE